MTQLTPRTMYVVLNETLKNMFPTHHARFLTHAPMLRTLFSAYPTLQARWNVPLERFQMEPFLDAVCAVSQEDQTTIRTCFNHLYQLRWVFQVQTGLPLTFWYHDQNRDGFETDDLSGCFFSVPPESVFEPISTVHRAMADGMTCTYTDVGEVILGGYQVKEIAWVTVEEMPALATPLANYKKVVLPQLTDAMLYGLDVINAARHSYGHDAQVAKDWHISKEDIEVLWDFQEAFQDVTGLSVKLDYKGPDDLGGAGLEPGFYWTLRVDDSLKPTFNLQDAQTMGFGFQIASYCTRIPLVIPPSVTT